MTALSTGETYTFDANGNMITRVEGGLTYNQTFDAENRLISVTVSGQTTQFIYDGDGNLVKKIKPDGSKTLYVGGIYEVDKTSGGTVTQTRTYYPAGGAMRIGSTLYYMLKDHLGSASVITNASGVTVSGGEQRYYPFGESRLTATMLTDKLFTGQREMAGLGIYHYQARFYSPKLGRFLSPDTLVPGVANPQSLNRFSYTLNNPIRYIDPSGHIPYGATIFEGDGPLPLAAYGVHLAGNWGSRELLAISQGVRDVARRFAAVRERGESAAGAFQAGFGTDSTPLYFLHGNTSNEFWDDGSGVDQNGNPRGCEISSGACTVGLTTRTDGQQAYLIKFVTMSSNPLSAMNNVVHELGHLFGSQVAGYSEMSSAINRHRQFFERPNTSENYGFASKGFPWQQSTHNVDMFYEVFADQFLGWTYDTWQASVRGGVRSNWMNVNMASWLTGP